MCLCGICPMWSYLSHTKNSRFEIQCQVSRSNVSEFIYIYIFEYPPASIYIPFIHTRTLAYLFDVEEGKEQHFSAHGQFIPRLRSCCTDFIPMHPPTSCEHGDSPRLAPHLERDPATRCCRVGVGLVDRSPNTMDLSEL